MGYKRPESVLVVLHDADGQVLIMQRMDDPLFWQSVTGTIEENESPIETAYREVAEETGVHLDPEQQVIVDCRKVNQYEIRPEWRYRYPPNTIYNTEHVFIAQISSATRLHLTEHLSYEWVPSNEAIDRVWSPSNRAAIIQFVPGAK